jgi:polyferredoxin
MKFPKAGFAYPFLTLRQWVSQPLGIALFFVSPWVNAFRVDMLTQQIWFWGKAYPFSQATLQWIPLVFFGTVLLIALTSVVLGRWFCGWTCPHNALTEWTRPLRQLVGREAMAPALKRLQRFKPKVFNALRVLSVTGALGLTFALSASLAGFVVPPAWIVGQWQSGSPHVALVFGQGLFTLIGLFLLYCGHDFCRTCCPYGMGQSISAYIGTRWRPMEIAFTGSRSGSSTADTCKTCTACQQACPVDIDPRQPQNLHVGQFAGCFNCGACIDACTFVNNALQTQTRKPSWLRFIAPRLLPLMLVSAPLWDISM